MTSFSNLKMDWGQQAGAVQPSSMMSLLQQSNPSAFQNISGLGLYSANQQPSALQQGGISSPAPGAALGPWQVPPGNFMAMIQHAFQEIRDKINNDVKAVVQEELRTHVLDKRFTDTSSSGSDSASPVAETPPAKKRQRRCRSSGLLLDLSSKVPIPADLVKAVGEDEDDGVVHVASFVSVKEVSEKLWRWSKFPMEKDVYELVRKFMVAEIEVEPSYEIKDERKLNEHMARIFGDSAPRCVSTLLSQKRATLCTAVR